MNLLCLLFLFATLFASVSPALWDLVNMMRKVLRVNPFNYINYGCYCGPGTGPITVPPVDGIDTCCYHHDHCYGDTKKLCKNSFREYYTNYSWTFNPKTKEIRCASWKTTCARALCECDVKVAKCFAYYTRLTGKKKGCTTNEYTKRWIRTKSRPFEPWHNQTMYNYYMTNGKYRLP
ncbi:unnamed protein product [Cylicocyclus nassatus]|uniref:Phospholipase A2 n=1 Tax=Cylicocyclus nassatus TaxID=53992 RepID=A0AA36GXZ3_CYLNA|nr:unnamed protein product [Cylicocyclus nassatus]